MSEAPAEASLLELVQTLVDLECRHVDELHLVVAGGGQDVRVTGADIHSPDGSILLDRVVIAQTAPEQLLIILCGIVTWKFYYLCPFKFGHSIWKRNIVY